MALPDCTEEELTALYEWVDSVPLSRPKKAISRDFADGVLTAELIHYFFPKLVELHNYSPAHNSVQKMYNWTTLNQKVFKRLGFTLARDQCEAVANAEAGAIERVLKLLRTKMARYQETGGRTSRQATTSRAGAAGSADGSQPGSPAGLAPHYQGSGIPQAAAAVDAAGAQGVADSIAALRLSPNAVQSKLLQSSALAHQPAATAFPTLDQAFRASLGDKEQQLEELRETNEILETKISKLEQLVRLKDAKIQALLARLQAAEQPAASAGAS